MLTLFLFLMDPVTDLYNAFKRSDIRITQESEHPSAASIWTPKLNNSSVQAASSRPKNFLEGVVHQNVQLATLRKSIQKHAVIGYCIILAFLIS